jgi:hypothetical protein
MEEKMKSRSLFLAVITTVFWLELLAFAQAPTPSNDPDNVDVQQEGQFGPGSTLDTAGTEPTEVINEAEGGLEADVPQTQTGTLTASSPLDSATRGRHEADAKFDALEALDADLNSPR